MTKTQRAKEILFVVGLVVVCIFLLACLGPKGYFIERDTKSYFPLANIEGVMLVYPIFLNILYQVCGEQRIYDAAVVCQIIIATICIVDFCLFVRKQFCISKLETFLLILAAVFPFTITLPDSMVIRQIMTEGLAYSFYYPFVKYLLKFIFTKEWKYIGVNAVFAFLLSMTRSQLRLVWVITAVGVLYVFLSKFWSEHKKKLIIFSLGILLTSIVFVCGVFSISYADRGLRKLIFKETVQVQTKEEMQLKKRKIPQIDAAVFARMMFAADKEDEIFFENAEVKESFRLAFDEIDRKGHRYEYAQKGLWMWKDIAYACTANPGIGNVVIKSYFAEKYENEIVANNKAVDAYSTIAWGLFKQHWGRYLWHTLCFIPSGFICTVFFQKEQIYALCHAITFLLYAMAVMGSIVVIKRKKKITKEAEQMLTIVVISCVFVCVTNLIFMGLQRYLIYPFGTFYIALYVLYRELFKDKVVNYYEKHMRKKNGKNSDYNPSLQ